MFRKRNLFAVMALLGAVSAAHASSAGFVIGGEGIELGKPEEVVEKGETISILKAKAEVGKPFILTAQGMAYPRGVVKGQPFAPDSGVWTFDEKAYEKSANAGKPDETLVSVTLTPMAAGTSRIRFVGKILGYDRIFEVVVEAAPAKKKE